MRFNGTASCRHGVSSGSSKPSERSRSSNEAFVASRRYMAAKRGGNERRAARNRVRTLFMQATWCRAANGTTAAERNRMFNGERNRCRKNMPFVRAKRVQQRKHAQTRRPRLLLRVAGPRPCYASKRRTRRHEVPASAYVALYARSGNAMKRGTETCNAERYTC